MANFLAKEGDISENIEVNVSTNNLKVLTSGLVFSIGGEEIYISIDDVKVKFEFIEEDDKVKPSIKYNISEVNNKELVVSLINFNNTLGQGIIKPLNFLYTEHFNLYISFYVYTLNDKKSNRQISYTIYYGNLK
ncbi:DUF6864 domain-containing function [Acinetobacter baumannii]|uniref:DUF6864 domain-containing function n=1 Tax=Acinetobacter baumannii TaxID=470 RepID=UPI0023AA9A37|nr:hypothetical protein [Acinetobacter baumannii]MDE5409357.1 hypothetical protein [Acinetobacter baumannii]MDV7589354.1 hypothetical protein [Acinetobacter baumannii]HCA5151335.1 hypothetical protein [Acinetobacter baumannii]